LEQELRSEEQQEQDITEQSGSATRTEQEISIMPTNTMATPMKGLQTVHATASDMFEIQDPLDVSQLQGGTCDNPCSDRGEDPKAIGKPKGRATYALDLKFGLPYYYVSGKYGEDEDNGPQIPILIAFTMPLFQSPIVLRRSNCALHCLI